MRLLMDHLFTTAVLSQNRSACDTGRHRDVFDTGLSDHLPIVADFLHNWVHRNNVGDSSCDEHFPEFPAKTVFSSSSRPSPVGTYLGQSAV